MRSTRTFVSARASFVLTLVIALPLIAVALPASAQTVPPWDGNPISAGLGPTYGEEWCAPPTPGSSIANLQGPPLAIIPQEAIGCTLDQILAEGAAAGIPERMTYEVIGQSTQGRDMYGVVVNAMESDAQRRDYANWQQLRSTMLSDPARAQSMLASFGGEVKIPIFIEANIHGGEREGTDAMMQVLRDLVTTPYGQVPIVDAILDHAVVVVIPTTNPDGRFRGTRQNANGFDMNRDLLVQSQPEMRFNIAFQLEWLAPVMLAMHGYANPTLIDGLTKPHNPGLEYDLFLNWNQRRLDANEAALAAIGFGIQRPVNQYDQDGGGTTGNPAIAEGWDDWGPFYTQTYAAFYGVDGSTLEMCSGSCGGRIGSKQAQYVGFYSSAEFWIDNRTDMLHDQFEIYRRGVSSAPRPNCCDNPLLQSRGFAEAEHNWMVPYPTAFVIPFQKEAGGFASGDGGQRSEAEANRLAQWLLDNGVEVHRLQQPYTWQGQTFPRDSYLVPMDQPFRGFAMTALAAGQDISDRITQLYAPPGAWSHGLLWGADTVEIPTGAQGFSPMSRQISSVNELEGGVRGGGPADWYAVDIRGAVEFRAVLDLLRSGLDGEIAEHAFTSESAGDMPAGSLIFPREAEDSLDVVGLATGLWFERGRGAKPDTTLVTEAPRVAVLVNNTNRSDTLWSLEQLFGSDAQLVQVTNGPNSLQNAADDPLEAFDVIYNAGQDYPSTTNQLARDRLDAFFQRGGGYIGTSQDDDNFTFMTDAGLVDQIEEGSAEAGGGIARWDNTGALASPLTGGYPEQDFLFLPSDLTYLSTVPGGATVAGSYPATDTELFVAGLWRDRTSADSLGALDAPVVVHGPTTVDSRYLALAANPFSRGDAEREWALIGRAALWSNLTDEAA
ncbi:MAG TPA: M14 family zinc carboxypeptidase [Actinomycetota bacterium]|nr:M14 family zinc carboxypeptidase [Actinomycetota bacterium]